MVPYCNVAYQISLAPWLERTSSHILSGVECVKGGSSYQDSAKPYCNVKFRSGKSSRQ
jgi:hypothetical protein